MAALIEATVGLALGFILEGTGLYVAAEEERDVAANAYEHLAWKETVQLITGEVANLPDREREIIRRHYLDGLELRADRRPAGRQQGPRLTGCTGRRSTCCASA